MNEGVNDRFGWGGNPCVVDLQDNHAIMTEKRAMVLQAGCEAELDKGRVAVLKEHEGRGTEAVQQAKKS